MDMEIVRLREELRKAEAIVRDRQAALNVRLNDHKHEWAQPQYAPILEKPLTYTGQYHYGSNWGPSNPDYDRPDKVIPRWVRTCTICGKTEETKATHSVTKFENGLKIIKEEPLWN